MVTVIPTEMITTHTEETAYGTDGHVVGLRTHDHRAVSAIVADCEPMGGQQPRFGRAAVRKWVPEILRIDYRRRDGGAWAVGDPVLSGHRVRADGSIGQLRAYAVYSEWNEEKPPAWVTEFVAAAHPDAAIKPAQQSGKVGSVPVPK
jgi:hypothetical protein